MDKHIPLSDFQNVFGGQEVDFFVSINQDASSGDFLAKVNENPIVVCWINLTGF